MSHARPTPAGDHRRLAALFAAVTFFVLLGCAHCAPQGQAASPAVAPPAAGDAALAERAPLPAPATGALRLVLASVPAATPAGAAIFVAGTFNGWSPAAVGYRLTEEGGGRFSIVLPDTVRGGVEFKFTLGSWERVETSASGADVPNRTVTVPDTGATYVSSVAGWKEPGAPRRSTASTSVSVLSDSFPIPQLGRTRRVWVYLPPDYATGSKRYPVLYLQDGENVFDAATSYAGEWGVDETLDSLQAAGKPVGIVVAVDHGGTRRFDEYSPWVNAKYGGGEGDTYVDFLVRSLKPYVDAHYRTRPDRRSTGIGGSSMGGLISLYAILKYPRVFGRALVFSPALWVAPEALAFVRAAKPAPDPRIYIVSGGLETAQGEAQGVYGRDQERMVEALREAGFDPRTEVRALVRPDGQHSEWFWRREFPAAYLWLFDAR